MWLAGAVAMGGMDYVHTHCLEFETPDSVQAANKKKDSSDSTEEKENTTDSIDPDTSLSSQLGAAQRKRDELKQEQAQMEKEVNRIQTVADDVIEYVKGIDAQVSLLYAKMESNDAEIEAMEEEVESVNEEYERVLEKQQEQYEQMKKRVRYMYENSDNNYLTFLMESNSLADLFSREEYIQRITTYDSNLFKRYQNIMLEVEVAKRNADDKMDQVQATKESLEYEKKALKMLSKEKNRQMKAYEEMLQNSQTKLTEYSQKVTAAENEVESLMAQQRQQITAQEADGETVQVFPTSGEYAWPLPVSGRITSTFGYRAAPTAGASTYHKGVDIAINSGTSVLATREGKVVTATYSSSAGYYVAIYHGNGIYSYYMHCSTLKVSAGDRVKQGQVIARSGSTGISTGPHLHFAIYKGNNYVNPMYYVSQP